MSAMKWFSQPPSNRYWLSSRKIFSYILFCFALGPTLTHAAGHLGYFELSIEELMDIEVTSVAKKPQQLSDTAAAVFVITEEDIRRSGATSIQEALRLAPGVQVARQDAGNWAISIRGFNDRHANKLLVLIDGRSVYSPLFSGVYWDVQDTVLADIERIEVIRGPGGTIWGANAVNGVINIITKQAADTQGGQLDLIAGNYERHGSVRHGGTLGDKGHYRVFFKYLDGDHYEDYQDTDAHDQLDVARGGFRADWLGSSKDKYSLQGNIYQGESDFNFTQVSLASPSVTRNVTEVDVDGVNLSFNWHRQVNSDSDFNLKFVFDRAERHDPVLDQTVDIYGFDFDHHLRVGENHELSWGVSYHRAEDELNGSFEFSTDPVSRNTDLYSAYIQDEIKLRQNLSFTIGSKFEHNAYSGFEYQPSIRLLWKPDVHHSWWGAISRAVRTPARVHSDMRVNFLALPGTPTSLFGMTGSSDLDAEEVMAFELGYRGKLSPGVSLDISTFYNRYDDLMNWETMNPVMVMQPSPHLFFERHAYNHAEGETYGIEIASHWQVSPHWRLFAGYSFVEIDLHLDSSATDDSTVDLIEGRTPEQQIQLRSSFDFLSGFELDAALYYVDSTPSLDLSDYWRLDVRLGWRPSPDLELALVGQNLLDQHPEFTPFDTTSSEIPRSFYGSISWQF